MASSESQLKLAVLIDADNTPAAIVEGLVAEIAKLGVASVKRIYGDWTNPHLKGWREVLLEHAIQPIQQFGYTVGKNATDTAMIIDAMDLLYTGRIDGFCIVSSDSDFTRLASRLREAGMMVIGFGEKKTPKSFVGACDRFIYTEILRTEAPGPSRGGGRAAPRAPKATTTTELKRDSRLVTLLRDAVEDSADDSGWADLGLVGRNVANRAPEFDPRNYGFPKLGELIRATDLFEIDERTAKDSPTKFIYVRDKRWRSRNAGEPPARENDA
jgi:uncharacterized LabA/DUF88 family protein